MAFVANNFNMTDHFSKVKSLQGLAMQNVQSFYSKRFPFEIRETLNDWITGYLPQPGQRLDPTDPQHVQYVDNLLPSLQCCFKENEMKSRSAERLKLGDAVRYVVTNYSGRPWDLANILIECLAFEADTLLRVERGEMITSAAIQEHQNITQELFNIKELLQHLHDLSGMNQEIEQYNVMGVNLMKLNAYIQSQQMSQLPNEQMQRFIAEKKKCENKMSFQRSEILRVRREWGSQAEAILGRIKVAQTTVVLPELDKWKRGQQLSGNGGFFENNIEMIQGWFETLALILWNMRMNLCEFHAQIIKLPLDNNEGFPNLSLEAEELLTQIIRTSFVIEKQPPQVMKTSTRYSTTVRLLVGHVLNVQMQPPKVIASIVSEALAKELIMHREKQESEIPNKEQCGTLVNCTATMESSNTATNKSLAANFRNMQLTKIKRTEKKGSESVMDEKFAIAFQTIVKVGDFRTHVFTLSLPIAAIVHGNQEPHAWATVTWDNAFSAPGRIPFVVPDKVPWPLVGELLSMKFKQYVGVPLNADALKFLASKVSRPQNAYRDPTQELVHWANFAKETLPDRNFTFWEWFYAILKVTREHLGSLWKEKAIHGFVEKKQSEELISKCAPGTFLLRFSDSELGGISITFVKVSDDPTRTEVLMTHPFVAKDLAIRGLADRINDLNNLTTLWPNIPKDQAFGKFYTPQQTLSTTTGYVRSQLACTLPGALHNVSLDSQPATPQSNYGVASSPDNSYYNNGSTYDGSNHEFIMNGHEVPGPQDALLAPNIQFENMLQNGAFDFDLDEFDDITDS